MSSTQARLLLVASVLVGLVALGGIVRRTVIEGARTPTGAPVAAAPGRRGRTTRPAPPRESDMATWCEHVARSLRGGSSLRRAMQDAAPAVPTAAVAVAPAVSALERGRGLHQALSALDDDPATPVGLVVGVLAACADLGGPAAAPLDRTAATLHARAAERAERITASAQARLSARVLTVLPAGTLALLATAEPATRRAVATSMGVACLIAGGLANVAGWWWMRRIIGRVA